ncbi:hypothetical protein DVH05_008749 [Phytophthora capsici]|nr:hypothetical protein DVH05_008749 [Phytophthora capsici]
MAKVSKKQHLKTEHLLSVVTWLEHSPNFELCFGVARQTSVGKQSTKTAGFKAMVEALAKNTKFVLSPKQMRERFTTLKNRYLRAKAYEDSTGAGIYREDERNGIRTMSQKMASLCTCYDRMDKLFREKANVEPLDAFDSTVHTPSAREIRGAFDANDKALRAFPSFADDDVAREEVKYAEDDLNNTPGTPRYEEDTLTPRSPPSCYASSRDDFCSIPLAQRTPDSFASASPLARSVQQSSAEKTASTAIPLITPPKPATQHAEQPEPPVHHQLQTPNVFIEVMMCQDLRQRRHKMTTRRQRQLPQLATISIIHDR